MHRSPHASSHAPPDADRCQNRRNYAVRALLPGSSCGCGVKVLERGPSAWWLLVTGIRAAHTACLPTPTRTTMFRRVASVGAVAAVRTAVPRCVPVTAATPSAWNVSVSAGVCEGLRGVPRCGVCQRAGVCCPHARCCCATVCDALAPHVTVADVVCLTICVAAAARALHALDSRCAQRPAVLGTFQYYNAAAAGRSRDMTTSFAACCLLPNSTVSTTTTPLTSTSTSTRRTMSASAPSWPSTRATTNRVASCRCSTLHNDRCVGGRRCAVAVCGCVLVWVCVLLFLWLRACVRSSMNVCGCGCMLVSLCSSLPRIPSGGQLLAACCDEQGRGDL